MEYLNYNDHGSVVASQQAVQRDASQVSGSEFVHDLCIYYKL